MLDLSHNDVVRLFDYDGEKGLLIWRTRPLEDFVCQAAHTDWNKKYVGRYAGTVNPKGRKRRKVRITLAGISATISYCRLVWLFHTGAWPKDTIDHIDGNTLNDRIENLRDVPVEENCKNKALPRDNKSGCMGVTFAKRDGRWKVDIRHNKKSIYLGMFVDKAEAIAVRKAAERQYGFHPNHGRAAR